MTNTEKKPLKGVVLAVLAIAGVAIGSTFFGTGDVVSTKSGSEHVLASMSPQERRAYYLAQNEMIENISKPTGLESSAMTSSGCDTSYTDCYVTTYEALYNSVVSALPYAQADKDAAYATFINLFSGTFTSEQITSIESQLSRARSSSFESNIIAFFEGMGITLIDEQVQQAILANEMASNVRIRLRFIDAFEARYATYCSKDSEDSEFIAGNVSIPATNTTYPDTCTNDTTLVERLCIHGAYLESDDTYNKSYTCEFGCFEGACRSSAAFEGINIALSTTIRPDTPEDVSVIAYDVNQQVDTDYSAGDLRFSLSSGTLPASLSGTFTLTNGRYDADQVDFSGLSAGSYTLSVLNSSNTSVAQISFTIADTSSVTTLLVGFSKKTTGTGASTVAQIDLRVEAHDETDQLVTTYSTDKLRFTLVGSDLKSEYQGHVSMVEGVFSAQKFLEGLPVGTYTLIATDDNSSPTLSGQTTITIEEGVWRPECATRNIYVSCVAQGGRRCTTEACPTGCVPKTHNEANNSCFIKGDMDQVLTTAGWKLRGYNKCNANQTQIEKERTLRAKCIVAGG